MEIAALVLSAIAIVIVGYDYNLRHFQLKEIEYEKKELQKTIEALQLVNNSQTKAFTAINQRLETAELKIASYATAATTNKRGF